MKVYTRFVHFPIDDTKKHPGLWRGELMWHRLNKRETALFYKLNEELPNMPVECRGPNTRCAFTAKGRKKFATLIKYLKKMSVTGVKEVKLKNPKIIWQDEYQIVFATRSHA